MADETRKTGEAGQKIVTLRSLELPASETLESVSAGPQGAAASPRRTMLHAGRYCGRRAILGSART